MSATAALPPHADAAPRPVPARDAGIQWGVALFTLVIVAAPLLPVLYQSFIDRPLYDSGQQLTLANFHRLFAVEGFGRVIWNTLLFAGLTTIISQGFGTLA